MAETRRPIEPAFIDALVATRDHAVAVAALVHYDLSDAQQRFLLSYFSTEIELAGGCIALAQQTESIGIPILARSALEAHVDFRCLLSDPRYVEWIEAAHDREWAKLMDEATRDGGVYLAQLGTEPSVREERARIAHREQHRAALGIRQAKAKEKFTRAEMAQLYYSVYNMLCAEAHNDARALINRHIKADGNDVVRLTIYGDELANVETGLMQVQDSLSYMTENICKKFSIAEPDRRVVDTTFAAAQVRREQLLAERESSSRRDNGVTVPRRLWSSESWPQSQLARAGCAALAASTDFGRALACEVALRTSRLWAFASRLLRG
jgi:hypothetical protein